MTIQTELIECCKAVSKHSQYQAIPPKLRPFLEGVSLGVHSRFEAERMSVMAECLPLRGADVLDIGANTGYFSFEVLAAGAKSVLCVEGCEAHARFIRLGAELLGVDAVLRVENRYYDFAPKAGEIFDVVFLLNVLHHLGDDFGPAESGREPAKTKMLQCLNTMAEQARYMAFQLGYNWMGNRGKPLFEKGKKAELIDFVRQGVRGHWHIEKILIAQDKPEGCIQYLPMSNRNLERWDHLGEFLNRPLFILRSLRL